MSSDNQVIHNKEKASSLVDPPDMISETDAEDQQEITHEENHSEEEEEGGGFKLWQYVLGGIVLVGVLYFAYNKWKENENLKIDEEKTKQQQLKKEEEEKKKLEIQLQEKEFALQQYQTNFKNQQQSLQYYTKENEMLKERQKQLQEQQRLVVEEQINEKDFLLPPTQTKEYTEPLAQHSTLPIWDVNSKLRYRSLIKPRRYEHEHEYSSDGYDSYSSSDDSCSSDDEEDHDDRKDKKCKNQDDTLPDYIIIGGGTSGLAAARGLLDRGFHVHIYNLDGSNRADPVITYPTSSGMATFGKLFGTFVDPKYSLIQIAQPDSSAFEQRQLFSNSRLLGGTTNTNYMLLSTGSSDSWQALVDATGDSSWSWQMVTSIWSNLKPKFNPYRKSTLSAPSSIFLQAAQNLASNPNNLFTKGLEVESTANYLPLNYNTSASPLRAVANPEWFLNKTPVTTSTGSQYARMSSDVVFLREGEIVVYDEHTKIGVGINKYQNRLKVFPNHAALRLLFSKERSSSSSSSSSEPKLKVTGVVFGVKNPRTGRIEEIVRASKKKILLCCGAIQTPALLQRSGYGPREVVLAQGSRTSLVFENEHVGRHLDNHSGPGLIVRPVVNDLSMPVDDQAALLANYRENAFDMNMIGTLGLSFLGWHENDPSKVVAQKVKYQMIFAIGASMAGSFAMKDAAATNDDWAIFAWDIVRKGRGVIESISGDKNVFSSNTGVKIRWNLFDDQRDLHSCMLAYDVLYRWVTAMNQALAVHSTFSKIEYDLLLPDTLEEYKNAMLADNVSFPELKTNEASLPDIRILQTFSEYVDAHPDDWYQLVGATDAQYDCFKAIETFCRRYSHPAAHQSGTCRMGKSKEDSVVDSRLHVHGVKDLMIADLSVASQISSGNTALQATIFGLRAGQEFA